MIAFIEDEQGKISSEHKVIKEGWKEYCNRWLKTQKHKTRKNSDGESTGASWGYHRRKSSKSDRNDEIEL